MWDKVKAFGAWLYNWMTVVGALVIGALSAALPYIDMMAALDWASVLPPATAAKAMFTIAFVKTVCVAGKSVYEWAKS